MRCNQIGKEQTSENFPRRLEDEAGDLRVRGYNYANSLKELSLRMQVAAAKLKTDLRSTNNNPGTSHVNLHFYEGHQRSADADIHVQGTPQQ